MAKLKIKIANYPKLNSLPWRIMLIDNGYFLYGEWQRAFEEAGMEVAFLSIRRHEVVLPNYYRRITALIEDFKPDLIFNINFMGFDVEGRLSSLFNLLKIPVIYWLIDHPLKIVPQYLETIAPKSLLLMIDNSWVKFVAEQFGLKSHFLPLSVHRPDEDIELLVRPDLKRVSYFAQTGLDEIERYSSFRPLIDPQMTDTLLDEVAHIVNKNSDINLEETLLNYATEKGIELKYSSKTDEYGFWLEILAYADFIYKKRHLKILTTRDVEIYGDEHWREFFPEYELIFPYLAEKEKFLLYQESAINVHLSSIFLPQTFNRKFLEIPLHNGFLLCDEKESYYPFYNKDSYHYHQTVSGLAKDIDYYLTRPKQRKRWTEYAKNEVLTKHLYEHRVAELISMIEEEFVS